MATFYLRKGDTYPPFETTLTTDGAGSPFDLTGCSVAVIMRERTSSTRTIDLAPGEVVDPDAGAVRYNPTAADSAVPGRYNVHWRVTLPDGREETLPQVGHDTCIISDTP